MIHEFDRAIVIYLNNFAHRSPTTDQFITKVLDIPSVKILPIVLCLVWLWFHREATTRHRSIAKQSVIGAFIALVIARLIQNLSPHRPRPIHSEDLNIVPPTGIPPDALREWSSFPSDNAALAFALAVGVAFSSKLLGALCLVWATFIVSLPRIYGGLHYPTDVIGGATIGVASTLICIYLCRRFGVLQKTSGYEQRYSGLYHSFLFFFMFQITILFKDVRSISNGFIDALKKVYQINLGG